MSDLKSLIPIPAEALAAAERLYDQGLYLQSAEALKEWGSPRQWKGTAARIFGGRLAGNLGAPRLASALIASSYRSQPNLPEARYFRACDCFGSKGPWAAWELLRDFETLPGASDSTRASVNALRGRICAFFKDRSAALSFFRKAHDFEADPAWVWTEQSLALEYLDDREGALVAVRKALDLHPWNRSAVQQAASLFLMANRDDEAEELFRCASEQTESGAILLQWITALDEREKFAVIPELCDQAQSRLPWVEKPLMEWLDARRTDAWYGLGEFSRAAEYAEKVGGTLYGFVAPRLRTPEEGAKRVKWPVPFVRQDNDTCAPASLASLAAYWNWDVTHDQIAEAVCYGGTQMHGLRQWVEERGWLVREFRVTWENCRALIDRGIPFLLATMEVGSGHAQVVEGYDALWKTLLIRDPNFRHHRRVPAQEFLARYEVFGPRGMLVLPPAESQRLDGLDLEVQRGFDGFHRFNLALARNDRGQAKEEFDAMAGESCPSFLLYGARLALADYDANELDRLRCLEAMEKEGFKHPFLTAARMEAERNFSDQSNRLDSLRGAARWEAPVEGRSAWDSSFLLTLAGELSLDEANFPEVRRLFRRYHAMVPGGSGALSFWGRQLWMRQQHEKALELFKFATTSADKVELYAWDYFQAAGTAGREEALETLRERFRAYGAKSSDPGQTLYSVLRSIYEDRQAFEVLAEAVQLRSEDGNLLAFAAYERTIAGEREEGHRLLEAAKEFAKPSYWLRTAASLAAFEGDIEGERNYWAEIARLEPLSRDAHAQHVRLINALEGPAAAVEYCKAKVEAFPFHVGFAEQLAGASLELGDAFAEPYVRAWVRLEPRSIPARAELIRIVLSLGRSGEALSEAKERCAANPHSSLAWSWLGKVYEETGHATDAREAYKTAIRLSVDNELAIRELYGLAADANQRQIVAEFIEEQLNTQLFLEAGLYAWFDFGVNMLSAQEMSDKLAAFRARRANCWPLWNCSVRLALRGQQIVHALELAEEARDRFGLLAPAWMDLAIVQDRAGKLDASADSLKRAIDLNPAAWDGWARLGWLRERQGRGDDAVTLLTEAVRRNPSSAVLQAVLAGILWRKGSCDDAFARMSDALRRSPEMQWAWGQYAAWCAEKGRSEHLVEFLGELAETRSGDAVVSLTYARALKDAGFFEKAEARVRALLHVRPRLADAYLLLSELLAVQKRYEEALETCNAKALGNYPPVFLKGQAAWIEAIRGRNSEAIERMRAAVKRDPAYAWGFERLAEWYYNNGQIAEARRAAKRAAELQPENGQAWQNWSTIEERLGNKTKATQLLREAISRDPMYTAGVLLLIRRLVLFGTVGEVQKVIETSSAGLPPPSMQAVRILLHLKQKQKKEAAPLIQDLCSMEGLSAELLGYLRDCCHELGFGKLFIKALEEAVRQPGLQPAAAVRWAEERILTGKWYIAKRLLALPAENGARREAIGHYLLRLEQVNNRELAKRLMTPESKADEQLWGQLGDCMVGWRPRVAWNWMRDWRDHPGVTPWTLRAAAAGALSAGELDEAFEISRTALAKATRDNSLPFHRLLVALEFSLKDEFEEAHRNLALVDATELFPWEKALRDVVGAVAEIQSTPEDQVRATWKKSVRRLRATDGTNTTNDVILHSLLIHLVKRLGKAGVSYSRFSFPRFGRPDAGVKLPQTHWARWSFATIAAPVALLVGIGAMSNHGGSGLSAALGGIGLLGCMLAGIAGIICIVQALREGEKWSAALVISLLGNSAIPLSMGAIFFMAAVEASQRPAVPARVATPFVKTPSDYHHPENLFSVSFKDIGEAMITPIRKTATSAAEGIGISDPAGWTANIAAFPPWAFPNPPEKPSDLIRDQLAFFQNDPRCFVRTEVVDNKGNHWARTGIADKNEYGREVVVLRDTALFNGCLVTVEILAPKEKYSAADAVALGEILDRWHSRLTLKPHKNAEEPSMAKAAPSPSVIETPLAIKQVVEKAQALNQQRRFDEALLVLQQALKEEPRSVELQTELVTVYGMLGRHDEAIDIGRNAVKADPGSGTSYGMLGFALLKADRVDESLEMNLKATELSPNVGIFWICRSLCHEKRREFPEAIEASVASIRCMPENEAAWTRLQDLYQQQNDRLGAETKIKELLKEHPNTSAGWYILGHLQNASGMPTAGLSSLKKSIDLNSRHAGAWIELGVANGHLGESGKAMEAFNAALEIDPQSADALNNLGYTLLLTGKTGEAIDLFKKCIKAQPSYTRAFVNLANAYAKAGEKDLASETCDSLAKLDPALAAEIRKSIDP